MMFTRFMDWFERHKFGVIGTLMLHTMVMFLLAMSELPKDEMELHPEEISLEFEAPPPPPTEEQARDLTSNEKVTNLSSNLTAEERERTNLSRSAQERISENVEQDLKEFERAEFERLAEERTAAGEDVVIPTLDPSKWDPKRYMPKKNEPAKVKGLTTVTYDFDNPKRGDTYLDVPAYLCIGQGAVVIRLALGRDGHVRKAEIDEGKTRADDCMRENALRSAQTARFNVASNAPEPQHGTITYIFLAQ